MTSNALDRFVAAVRNNPVLEKLEAMAREVAGGTLFVLYCRDDNVFRLFLDGREADLPKFCRLTRGTHEGERRCSVCRSLVAVRACYQGLTDYCCHGGISVIAAPVRAPAKGNTGFLVVSSCAFADPDRARGWQAARRHADGLPIDMGLLRKAYYGLPVLEQDKALLVRSIVDLAACILAELEVKVTPNVKSTVTPLSSYEDDSTSVDKLLVPALAAARDSMRGKRGKGTASNLVEVVTAIVGNNPAVPFTATNVARAARMTPNHFSMVFHRHAGKSFTQFLSEHRIALARTLLSNLTLSINEVARRSGFADASYFSRRFKQVTGMTPLAYREQLN